MSLNTPGIKAMPSKRIVEKRSKQHDRLLLHALSQPAKKTETGARTRTALLTWSQDFVVRDASLPVDEILSSLPKQAPKFIVLSHRGKFVAVRPEELRRADQPKSSTPGGKPVFRPGHPAVTARGQSAADALGLSRTARPASAPWLRRQVKVSWSNKPFAVGESEGTRRTFVEIVSPSGERVPPTVVEVDDRDTQRQDKPRGPAIVPFPSPDARAAAAPPNDPDEPPPPPPPGGSLTPGGDSASPMEDRSVVRYPSIRAREKAVPGELLLIDVDLLRLAADPETESTGFQIDGLPDDWQSLPVLVHVACEHLEFDAGREQGIILVQRGRESVGCMVAGRVSRELTGDALVITAVFSHNGRACALAEARVPLAGAPEPAEQPSPARCAEEAEARACQIRPGASGAALTVVIKPESASGRKLHWILLPRDKNVPGLPAKLDGVIDLGVQPRTFVKRLLDQADSRRKGMHMAMLESLGQLLYEYAPECFRDTYWALRRANPGAPDFSIQFICGEPHIPWEMMVPYIPDTGETAGFLFADHPVGRWLADYSGWMMPGFRKGRVLSITPDYTRARKRRALRIQPLPWAQREGKFLRQKVGALSVRPTFAEVIRLLQHGSAETVTMLHFAGHGSFDWARPEQSHIFLEDEELKATEIRNSKFTLGRTHRPLVIFNACETGASGRVLDKVAGWANSFVHTRFGGFIAPLWSVYDDDAAEVVSVLVTRVMNEGMPVSVALQQLRRERAEISPTFLGYLYYGDVMACVS